MDAKEILSWQLRRNFNKYADVIKGKEKLDNNYIKSDIAKEYKKIISNEKKLLNTLVTDKDIDTYFSVYHYLLWNGYLSLDNNFIYDDNIEENISNLGLNVSTGRACCRNVIIHFNNLMNSIKRSNFILIGTRYKDGIKALENTPEIVKNKVEIEKKKANILIPTHAESFNTKNHYVYDPLNFNIQYINKEDRSYDNFTGLFDIGIQSVFGVEEVPKEEKIEKLFNRMNYSRILERSKKEPVPTEELIKLRQKGIEICLDNKDLLQEHQENTKKSYQFIKKKLYKE